MRYEGPIGRCEDAIELSGVRADQQFLCLIGSWNVSQNSSVLHTDSLYFELVGCDDVGQAEHPLVHGNHLGGDVQAATDVAHDSCSR